MAALGACGAYLAVGQLLRRSGLIQDSDTQVARKVIHYATLPSLMLVVLQHAPISAITVLRLAAVGLAGGALTALSGWIYFGRRKPREKSVLLGCTLGSTAHALPFAFAQAALGAAGLQCAVLLSIINSVAVSIGSYLAFGSAGAAFPEQFQHADGGTYRGEWDGMDKSGCGTYKYPSKARYEGEWQANTKEGSGVYYYPKGGLYKGDWRDGVMEGTGVRVFKSGRLAAGRWAGGRLVEELPLQSCAPAVQAADRAAQAARQVKVGGGRLSDAVQLLTTSVPFWAALAGAALALSGTPLPPTLAAIAPPLAAAHLPLALMTAGAALQLTAPQQYQLRDIAAVLAARLVPVLLAGAAAAALAPPVWLPYCVSLALLLTGPVADECLQFVHDFRLDERLAASVAHASTLASLLVAGPLAYVAAQTGALGAMQAARRPLMYTMLAGAAMVAAAAVALAKTAAPRRPVVRMVYKAPLEKQQQQQQQLQQPAPPQTGSPGGSGQSGQPPPTAASAVRRPRDARHAGGANLCRRQPRRLQLRLQRHLVPRLGVQRRAVHRQGLSGMKVPVLAW